MGRYLLYVGLMALTLLGGMPMADAAKTKKVVLIAGKKSHGPGDHEYQKGCELFKHCLETSPNLKGFRAEVHTDGWPKDPKTLEDADAIVVYCDGSDHNEADHPLLYGDRLETLNKAMRRGAGLVVLHYTVFVPTQRGGPEFLEWVGGFFDYQSGTGNPPWYSRIQTAATTPEPATPNHPISRGLASFPLREEYYYRIRFRENDPRRVPILTTTIPNESERQTVAWAVERRDGGRGFGYTGGHFHSNWENPQLRKMVLNAIVWAAKGTVPKGGVQSFLPGERVATNAGTIRTLILTGHHHPAHDWRATTAALQEVLGKDRRFQFTVWEDPERLAQESLTNYHLIIQNYNNWQRPTLSDRAKVNLLRFVTSGKGLLLLHFANGAFLEWPEYRRLSRRVWIEGTSSHDPYGPFQVDIRQPSHPITQGMTSYPTTDELYFKQQGELPLEPLVTARSKVTGQDEPLAYAYVEGKGRVFQSLLGHDVAAIRAPGTAELLRRGAAWAVRQPVRSFLSEMATTPVETSGPRLASLTQTPNRRGPSVDWPTVGNDPGGMRYTPLKQINRENVKNLEVAWTYHTGDADPKANTTIECTPIVVDGVMYLTTVQTQVVALDAATGFQLWKYNPRANDVNRGVAYWSDGKPNGKRRILFGTGDARLLSLDAKTGLPDPAFGKEGAVHLREGLEPIYAKMNYNVRSAPAIFENLAIIPPVNSEGQPGAPGDVRAFDVRTGKEVWRFHTVPRPGEVGHETWEGDSWKERSGTNPWSGFTVDTKRGLVFCGIGSAAFDFYGGDRKGQNLFANSTVALDARTGKRVWHFQTLHHDLWDHDLPCPPVQVTVTHNGRKRDATAQVTKTGYLFLFDRVTGKPLFPVEERSVPQSDTPGEQSWPTQPFPVKPPPFSRQMVTESDLTDISPESAESAREQFRKLRGGSSFTPPSLQGTVVIPGFHGGANWSGAAFDPTTGLLYVNSNNVPDVETLVKLSNPAHKGLDYTHTGYIRFLDKFGYPAIKPPWGNLTAIDLNKGEIAWQVVHGTYPELLKKGLPPTGTENFGGAIVTAGGLVFIGGTKDEKFRAYDKATGKILWEYQLPAGGYATPCTYQVNGRQYVVIAAGGGGKLATKPGDAFIAFALPKP